MTDKDDTATRNTGQGHTPGPWAVKKRNFDVCVSGAATEWVCVCPDARHNRYGINDADEIASNARLIAAAPDMLEALRFLRANYDVADVVDPIIAKATGGAA